MKKLVVWVVWLMMSASLLQGLVPGDVHPLNFPSPNEMQELLFWRLPQPKIHEAVERGDGVEVKRLVEVVGVNLEKRNARLETPLFVAVKFDQEDIVLYLLSRGARIGVHNIFGKSLMKVAQQRNNSNILGLLAQYSPNYEEDENKYL